MGKLWTEQENERMREYEGKYSYKEMTTLFPGRTYMSIANKARKLNLTKQKQPNWTEQENKRLIDCYKDHSYKEIVSLFPGRTFRAIKTRAYKLNITIKNKCKNQSSFIKISNIKHNNKYDYSLVNYVKTSIKVKIICKKHGIFTQTPNVHTKGSGCPKCGYYSNGEIKIEQFLQDNNIRYESQYTNKKCKNKHVLRFDFAYYIKNKLHLIEFNGIQHYEFIEHWHRNTIRLKEYQKKDKIKVNYCKKNNIPLLIIKYTDFDNINNILENRLIKNT